MRPSTDLHTLIRSLTPSEKRYFKLYSSMQGGRKNYVQLFDAIAAQPEYDEAALKEQFAGQPFLRQFNVARKYLYDLILRSLSNFHVASTTESRVRELLRSVEILFERGLTTQALRQVDRAIELAERSGRTSLELEARSWRRRLLHHRLNSADEIDRAYEPQRELLDRMRLTLEIQETYYRVRLLTDEGTCPGPIEREELREIVSSAIVAGEGPSDPFLVRYLRHAIWMNYYRSLGLDSMKHALDHAERKFELFRTNPEMVEEEPRLYVGAIGDCIFLSRAAGDISRHDFWLDRMREVRSDLLERRGLRHTRTSAQLFESYTSVYVGALLAFGRFDEMLDVREMVESCHDEFTDLLSSHTIPGHLHFISQAWYATGDLKNATRYIGRAILQSDEKRSVQIGIHARLTAMAYYYELGDLDYLEHLVRSVRRILRAEADQRRHPAILADLFHRLPRLQNRSESDRLLLQTEESLLAIAGDPDEIDLQRYFGYILWVRARRTGRPYAELVHENVERELKELDRKKDTIRTERPCELPSMQVSYAPAAYPRVGSG